MLSYKTVEPHTWELLKRIMAEPLFADFRLVGGTALALQYGQKYPEYSKFRALMSLAYFEDAEDQLMPKMFKAVSWETIKKKIESAVKAYRNL